jgi:hypothetical protein
MGKQEHIFGLRKSSVLRIVIGGVVLGAWVHATLWCLTWLRKKLWFRDCQRSMLLLPL